MKPIQSKILLSMLLFVTGKTHAMLSPSQSGLDMAEETDRLEPTWPKADKAKEPIITLGLIDNQIIYPDNDSPLPSYIIEWIINETEIDCIRSGRKKISNRVLFSRKDKFPLTKQLDVESYHQEGGSRKLTLQLEMETSNLKIVKDFSDGTQRPQEFYPIEPDKEYLLNLIIKNAANGNGDEVVVDLVEDNN